MCVCVCVYATHSAYTKMNMIRKVQQLTFYIESTLTITLNRR